MVDMVWIVVGIAIGVLVAAYYWRKRAKPESHKDVKDTF